MKKLLPLCLVATFAGQILATGAPAVPLPVTEKGFENRVALIIAVNPAERMVTVRIRGQDYRFLLNSRLLDTRTRRQLSIGQLFVGQLITFLSIPRSDGQLEIVSLLLMHGTSNVTGTVDGLIGVDSGAGVVVAGPVTGSPAIKSALPALTRVPVSPAQ